MVEFIDTPRFPDDIAYGTRGGPEYDTRIVELGSGHEHRNAVRALPLHRYNAAYGVRHVDQLEAVLAYHHAAGGAASGFRFKDFMDFKSCPLARDPTAADQAVGTGDGTRTRFALAKGYTVGTVLRVRPITHPIASTLAVAVDGTAQASGWHWDTATYEVVFDTAPADQAVITAGFEFDVPVRFESDFLEITVTSCEHGTADIPLREYRL